MSKELTESYGEAKLIVQDREIASVNINEVAYEDNFINLSVSHSSTDGFDCSILNKKTKTMTFYKIGKNGKFKEEQKENVITGDSIMLRDDIVAKVFYILQTICPWVSKDLCEEETFAELDLDSTYVAELVRVFIVEFELEDIAFAKVMEWQRLSDVIDCIENMLEEKQPPMADMW